MKSHLNLFFALIALAFLPLGGLHSQTTPTILINGDAVMASHLSASPYWLSSGQTLATGNLVKFISVIEFDIVASPNGGNVMQLSTVKSVTSQETVPTNKTWKVEAVALDPSSSVFGGDNLGNHEATTNLNMSAHRINDLSNPTALTDAANARSVQTGSLIYAQDVGTADNYSIALPIPPASYSTGIMFTFRAANTNTGAAATLNVNGLGAVPLKKQGSASDLASGDIASGQMVTVIYDGVNFQIVGQLGNLAGGSPTGRALFTTSGNFSVPAGVTTVYLTMCGGGGGGRYVAGPGGGGAASAKSVPYAVTPLESISVGVGVGGSAVSQGSPANNGTASSFGAFVTNGGFGSGNSNGAGGTGSSGSIPGMQGFHLTNNNGEQNGGWSMFGTAGRFFNCGGTMPAYANGTGFGVGGASTLCPMSGSGAPGFVLVEW